MKLLKIILCLMVLALPIVAQNSAVQQNAARDQQTISVNVDLVNILFTVTDRKGKLITDLKREDFRVFEDDKPQVISNFSSETDLPLTIALLIDTSGSIRDKLRFEQEAAIEFFYSTLRRGKDKGLLMTFDSAVDLLQDYTDDPAALAAAVRKIRAGGGTALYDAINGAATQKLAKQPGRRVIILISDGVDNSSRISLTETLEAVQKNDIGIFTISTNSTISSRSGESDRGDKTLKKLSDETGGKTLFPFKLQDLTMSLQDISEQLRSQYTLAYRPANTRRDGAFRSVRIEPPDKKYLVKARKGYYAPRDTIGGN